MSEFDILGTTHRPWYVWEQRAGAVGKSVAGERGRKSGEVAGGPAMSKEDPRLAFAEKLRTARVVEFLPHLFDRNESVPPDLIGATVLRFGTFEDKSLVEGGGLAIDYVPSGESKPRRLVFAMNELAMWVVYHRPVPQSGTS